MTVGRGLRRALIGAVFAVLALAPRPAPRRRRACRPRRAGLRASSYGNGHFGALGAGRFPASGLPLRPRPDPRPPWHQPRFSTAAKRFTVRTSRVGASARPGLLRGYVRPERGGPLQFEVVPASVRDVAVWVDGKRAASVVDGRTVRFTAGPAPAESSTGPAPAESSTGRFGALLKHRLQLCREGRFGRRVV